MVLGFTEVYWTLVLSTGTAFLLAVARMCYKSKCKRIKFCGLDIERDTEAEEREDEKEMELRGNVRSKKSDDPLANTV